MHIKVLLWDFMSNSMKERFNEFIEVTHLDYLRMARSVRVTD